MNTSPLVTQTDLEIARNAARLLMIASAAIRRKVLAGGMVESGRLTLNLVALQTPVPICALETTEDELALSPAGMLRRLLDGVDLRELRAQGFAAAARMKRRANLRVFWELVSLLEKEAARCIANAKAYLKHLDDYSRLKTWARAASQIHRDRCLLRAAGVAYMLHLPQAAGMVNRALDSIERSRVIIRQLDDPSGSIVPFRS